ncbi:MAG: acyl-CoA dehydrogenase family protein [Planctomycetes bacterium]|nr:acyl-CoA dehydrogenase family protein [Planctomycetota bacterium]NUQ35340.1 acyl-CoA dehydrogenase family protein [Planctomycetaceae bacterium]
MDFQLNEELKTLQDTARKFAETELKTKAREMDHAEKLDLSVFKKMAEQGFTALTIPEKFGGAGTYDAHMANQAACIVLEEINRRCASTGVTLSVHMSLFSSLMTKWASDDIKSRYLPDMASGKKIGAYCLSEAGAGSDAGSLQTRAKKNGDHYILNGTKLWITSGEYADVFIVMARTSDTGKTKDISSFVVDAKAPGVSISKKEKKMGIRASATNEVVLQDVKVPANNLIGEEGIGFKIALDTLDGGRIGIAAQAVGIARASVEDAVEYAKTRQQFEQPIAQFQAIQFKLADMAMRVDAARLLMYRAAWLRDNGLPCGKEAAMAKLAASEAANYCAKEAVQIFGGNGYSREYDVERYFRDARITEIYEGTSEVQRIVISRAVLA